MATPMADDPALGEWFARVQRLSASPAGARLITKSVIDVDVRDALARVGVPTLVMHRRDDKAWDVRHSRYIAQHVPGVHTGECELIGDDVGGMAVHIAARVGALAAAGEVLVSGTVFGTVVGGPFDFDERGFRELKGVPGRWPLFALGGPDG